MKKLFIIMAALLISATTALSQKQLTNGFVSGISETTFKHQAVKQGYFIQTTSSGAIFFNTVAKGERFSVFPVFNDSGKLCTVVTYHKKKYDKNTFEQLDSYISSIKNLLTGEYGDPVEENDIRFNKDGTSDPLYVWEFDGEVIQLHLFRTYDDSHNVLVSVFLSIIDTDFL